jgi:hypothetical protein
LFGLAKYVSPLKMEIDGEALEGMFGFFQVAYKSMVYFVNFQHILFLSELTFCTTILVHHVLPYVVVLHGSHVRDGCDLIQREPTVASVSRHVLPYVDDPHYEYARQGYTPFEQRVSEVGRCPCSDKRMGTISIVNGNVCGCFRECWHERFVVFCDLLQVH